MRRLVFLLVLAMVMIPWPVVAQEGAGGDFEATLVSDGLERRFLYHVPPTYDPATPVPLVISYHGYTDNPEDHSEYTRWKPKADTEGFIVAFPEGQGEPPGWYPYVGATRDYYDDVQFARDVIAWFQSEFNIDPRRIYASGMSNGGGMAGRIGCDVSDILAAIGPVSGNHVHEDPCHPLRPVPVVAIHGQQDAIAPYDGLDTLLANIPQWTLDWATRNGCDLTPQVTDTETVSPTFQSDILIETYTNCDDEADVVLHSYAEMGHAWPVLTAVDIVWAFFAAHPMPQKYLDGTVQLDAAASAPATPAAPRIRIPPGDYVGTVPGWNRDYFVHVPEGYTAEEPVPLLISFHDLGANPPVNAGRTGFNDLSDAEGFIAVYPGGSGNPLGFNVQADAPSGAPDDAQMTRDLIDYLLGQYTIDPQRIYVVGFSLGGGMAHRAACDLSDVIAGASMVAGVYFEGDVCQPTDPVSILGIHGMNDPLVLFDGDTVTQSIPTWAARWAEHNGCAATPDVEDDSDAGVRIETWGACADGVQVVLRTMTDLGHDWPDDAAAVIWAFFETQAATD